MQHTMKVWGERYLLREDSTHAVSYLRLTANTRCSYHFHKSKSNLFFVIKGKVGIRTEYGETLLTSGQEFTVEPMIWHEFRVYEDSEMIEEMYVNYDESDIERKTLGSKL